MTELDDLIRLTSEAKLSLPCIPRITQKQVGDNVFQVPLISLTILVLLTQCQQPKGIQLAALTTLAIRTLVLHFDRLTLIEDQILCSFYVRDRCAQSLAFLETVDLLEIVEQEADFLVKITARGSEALTKFKKTNERLDDLTTGIRHTSERLKGLNSP